MNDVLSALTVTDWIFLGLVALVPLLMALGIASIRREARSRARLEARSVRLKTTQGQRRQWRQQTQSRELLDLLDDIDTLMRQVAVSNPVTPQDHREAVRLVWKSRHIPVMTFLAFSLALAGVLSAVFMVIAQGPSNPIP
ncbi:MAG TPA: hypothetical protein VIW92_14585 [Thermoanaerobaculia bacterium]